MQRYLQEGCSQTGSKVSSKAISAQWRQHLRDPLSDRIKWCLKSKICKHKQNMRQTAITWPLHAATLWLLQPFTPFFCDVENSRTLWFVSPWLKNIFWGLLFQQNFWIYHWKDTSKVILPQILKVVVAILVLIYAQLKCTSSTDLLAYKLIT
jgi:hypothetical protein